MKHINRIFKKDTYKGENPIKAIRLFFQDLKFCIQRIRKGYCDRDLWNIDYWLLSQLPSMLKEYKESKHGYPSTFENEEAWDAVLDEMIFLFTEAHEKTCSKENPYDDEYYTASNEFTKKYGTLGEKLRTPEEIEKDSKLHCRTAHFMSELPEYKEIYEKHSAASKEIYSYRHDCENKAMALFNKHFHDLWD